MKKITLIVFTLCLSIFNSFDVYAQDEVTVADLGELVQQEVDGTIYTVSGEVILTHQHGQRNQKFIQDDTGAILIDDDDGIITTEYNLYDGISGLRGTLSVYNELLQFVPAEDPGAATSSDNTVEPTLMTLDELTTADQSMLVRINEVQFNTDETTFNPSNSYDIMDPSGTGILRTPSQSAALDYFGTGIPEGTNDMIFLVSQFNETMQVFPRSIEDIYLDGVPAFTLTFDVKDEEDNAVTDAVVTFDGQIFAAGEYVFEDVLAGNYDYSVEKSGFYTRNGNVSLSGSDITLSVVLVAEDNDAVTTYPFVEGFDVDDIPPGNWSHFVADAGSWQFNSDIVNSGDGAVFHTFTSAGQPADSWLVSPQLVIDAESELLLKFFERNGLMNDYAYSGVKISTGSGNPIHDEFEEVYESSASLNNFTEKVIDLSDYTGEVIYIAFHYQGENAHQWYVDDFSVEAVPEAIEVADIATLRQQDMGSLVYHLTGEAILTHQHGQRNQKYIQDATGAIVIDDPDMIITTAYELYDGITGIKGTLSVYNNLIQFTPTEDPGAATSSGNTVDPLVVTLADIAPEHQAMLIWIEGVTFDTEENIFTSSFSYPISDESGSSIFRTPSGSAELDYFETGIPVDPTDMIALVSQFGDDMQIFARSLDDFGAGVNVENIVAGDDMMIYPNPVHDQLQIKLSKDFAEIIIVNSIGQQVERISDPSDLFNVDMKNMQSGLYFISFIEENGQVETRKIIKR